MPRGGQNVMQFTAEQVRAMLSPRTHAALAREFGCSDMPVRRWRKQHGWVTPFQEPARSAANGTGARLGTPGRVDTPDGSTVTSPPIRGGLGVVTNAEAYLRERWGFSEAAWACERAVGNEWEGGDGEGGSVVYGQVKGTFAKLTDIAALLPAPGAWKGPRFARARVRTSDHQIIVVGDSQAPYHDEALHDVTCEVIRDLQPRRIVHIGDLCDYTNISKHADHAVVKASVDECTQAGVEILYDMRSAAPDAQFDILAGNHDIRPLSELLQRAERMAGIRRAGLPSDTAPRRKLLDLRELWRLDDLGIGYVEDERGWMHGELDLVPGPRGLAAVHGDRTGRNVALNTLASVGRSVICGHTHRAEMVYQWNATIGFEMRAMVIGAQCAVRGDKNFPTFVARDKWLQGGALVTVHAGGEWQAERMRWNGEALFVGSQRWSA